MFDNFPYTNFHEMNLDWMIKIAKDFLDQYTHIQETITTGLEDLDTKAQQLEALLQAWYDEHSEDIADQLADALNDLNAWYTEHQDYLDQTLQDNITAFNTEAEQIVTRVIASIPADYTAFYNSAMVYHGVLTNNTDLNTVTDNGIWGINSSNTYPNKPSQIESGFILSVKYQNNFNIQLIMELDGSEVFSRENVNGTWHNWRLFNNKYVYAGTGILPNNKNLDNVDVSTVWGLSSENTYSNKPADVTSGILITYRYDNGNYICIQTILTFDEGIWTRYYLTSWSAWKKIDTPNAIENFKRLGNNIDLNTITYNSIYSLQSDRTYPNIPFSDSGWLLTLEFQSGIYSQFTISLDGKYAYIRYYVNSWSDWQKLSTNGIENLGHLPNSSNFDDIQSDSIYALVSSNTYYNSPLTSSGWLVTLKFQSNIIWQLAMDLDGQESYVRYYLLNHWEDWISQTRKNPTNHYYAFGDSIVYGQSENGARSKNNYPAQIGLALQMKTHNQAVRGQGLIKDWNTIHTDYIQGLDMSNAKLISIGWAYNDSQYYSGMPFGSADSVDSTSFIGKHYTIMKEFQQKCPFAKIVLITGYGYPNGTLNPLTKPTLTDQFSYVYTFSDTSKSQGEIYDTLEAMCHNHGWSCINQHKGTAVNEFNADQVFTDQIHLTNDGYYVYGQYIAGQMIAMYANTSI